MNPELVRAGLSLSAVALIAGAAILLITGSAQTLGEAFREAVEPTLAQVRSRTNRSRSELADLSMLVAIGLSMLNILGGNPVVGTIVALVLYLARPAIRRATRHEHRLMAMGGLFSIDLIIGLYLPFVVAHLMMFDWLMAACLSAVVLALSWPAGGGETIPGRRWHLAPLAG
ncbi:MAG: hypothetical protein OEW83_08620 [Acidimicrobiia bacterium]|nr:hypothetical protein [Acidimicrobiia bacterium]